MGERRAKTRPSDVPENLIAAVFCNSENPEGDSMVGEIASSVCSFLNLAGACSNVWKVSIKHAYEDVQRAKTSADFLILSGVMNIETVNDLVRSKTLGEDNSIKRVIVISDNLTKDLWQDLLCKGVDFVIPYPFKDEDLHEILQLAISGSIIQRKLLHTGE